MKHIHGISSVFVEENKIQHCCYAKVSIGSPGRAKHTPGGKGGKIPGKKHFYRCGNDHVNERNGRFAHALQNTGSNLLHSQKEYAKTHDCNTGARIRGRIKHGGNRSGNDAHAHESRNRNEVGQPHGGVGPLHYYISPFLSNRFRNDRHQAGRQGSGHNGGHIHKGSSHAGEIAEESRSFFHRKSCHFQTPGHNEKVDVGYDGQHNISQ